MPSDSPSRNVDVARDDVHFLAKLLSGELQRHRAIVHIDNLRSQARQGKNTGARANRPPLIERLGEYPAEGVDLKNIVQYPPRLELIPLKPIFLDVAWNYINYPGENQDQAGSTAAPARTSASAQGKPQEPAQPAKKGWFGFGRS